MARNAKNDDSARRAAARHQAAIAEAKAEIEAAKRDAKMALLAYNDYLQQRAEALAREERARKRLAHLEASAPAPPVGRPRDPKSLSSRVQEVVDKHPNTIWTAGKLARKLRKPATSVSSTLAILCKRQKIRRVATGEYQSMGAAERQA